MTKYMVIEDNAGGLALAVMDNNGICKYLHTGYEYTPGDLAECIAALKNGADPIADGWDGNDENPQETFESMTGQPAHTWETVADENGIYPDIMGLAAAREFKDQ